MNNFNNSNNSTPDATSMANVGSGPDLGMRCKYGGEELEVPNYLQRNSTTIQKSSNIVSNRPQWRPENNNGADIKYDYITNNNCTGRAVLYIFDELHKKEKKEEKKEEENEGKKEGENEKTKGKKKKKKNKEAKTEEIRMSTPRPASKLDEHSRASPQQTSNSGERFLEDQSQKNNSLLWSIGHSSNRRGQRFPDQGSIGKRLVSFPEKSGWDNKSESRVMGLRELCGNDSLDSPSKAGAQYSDQYAHNQCANERDEATLRELSNLPDLIFEHLDKNNRFKFHQITKDDPLDFVDIEYIEYLNETFGITDIKPVFVDRSGYVIWLLDKDRNMYEWNEMRQSLRYMGKDLTDGLTNYFIHPENICQIMEYTGERVPVKEFERRVEEKAKRIWDNRKIIN